MRCYVHELASTTLPKVLSVLPWTVLNFLHLHFWSAAGCFSTNPELIIWLNFMVCDLHTLCQQFAMIRFGLLLALVGRLWQGFQQAYAFRGGKEYTAQQARWGLIGVAFVALD